VLDFLIQNIGIDRLVLGSDYCFDMGYEQPVTFLDCLALPPVQKNLIPGDNAAQLLKI
jgi:aminocarboxymuconate-semialdehyde decarboxylase